MNTSNEIKLVALFGKSASGKSTLQEKLVAFAPGIFHKVVSSTTRPPREGERNTVHYHFLNRATFLAALDQNKFVEATEFNGWFYGTLIQHLDKEKINIGVFNVEGLENLLSTAQAYGLSVVPVFVIAEPKTRLLRSLQREENPDCAEICRRFFADEKDFENRSFDYEMTWLNDDEGIIDDMEDLLFATYQIVDKFV